MVVCNVLYYVLSKTRFFLFVGLLCARLWVFTEDILRVAIGWLSDIGPSLDRGPGVVGVGLLTENRHAQTDLLLLLKGDFWPSLGPY